MNRSKANMKDFFYPSSVVVIGVSTVPSNLGKEIARNLLEFQFNGIVHLVGLDGGVIFGRKIHRRLEEIEDPIDLAIILTPAKTVPSILEDCGKKGIRRVIIESGGFGEFSDAGRDLQAQLRKIATQYGIRFIGPNCIGLINASNGLATPFPTLRNVFRKGGVGIVAQSGGVALSFLNMFDSEQLGYSKFASIGNKLDVDESDLVEYLMEDPETKVICLYVESIKDGRRFTELGRKSPKPIVVHKANIGALSRVIAQSHTEALANDDQVVDAALHQVGIARLRDMQSYLDFVKILQLPPMTGRNLAIVSRSGGHAVIAADAAHTYGFNLPAPSPDLLQEIRKHMRADVIKLTNPLDLGDLFDFDVYAKIIRRILQEDAYDGVLLVHTYFAAIEGASSRRLLRSAAAMAQEYGKPVALCVATEPYEVSSLHKELEFPIFLSPERAVRALDAALRHDQRRRFVARQHEYASPDPPPHRPAIREYLGACLAQRRSPLLHEALEIIAHAGFATPAMAVLKDVNELQEVCKIIEGPYAVKAIAPHISHKSDQGAVVLDLENPASLESACRAMFDRFAARDSRDAFRILVQKMAPRQVDSYELIVGGKRDPQFGPMALLGHGGLFVEIFAKGVLRMAPVTLADVDEMIDELPGSEILSGVRGRPAVDRPALRDAIVRVADLMTHFPEIQSIDINPLIVSPAGAIAVDARIFLHTGGQ
jgi:acetyltransferase